MADINNNYISDDEASILLDDKNPFNVGSNEPLTEEELLDVEGFWEELIDYIPENSQYLPKKKKLEYLKMFEPLSKGIDKVLSQKTVEDAALTLFLDVLLVAPFSIFANVTKAMRERQKQFKADYEANRAKGIETNLGKAGLTFDGVVLKLAKESYAWILDDSVAKKIPEGKSPLTRYEKAHLDKYKFAQSLPRDDKGHVNFKVMSDYQKKRYKSFVEKYTEQTVWKKTMQRLSKTLMTDKEVKKYIPAALDIAFRPKKEANRLYENKKSKEQPKTEQKPAVEQKQEKPAQPQKPQEQPKAPQSQPVQQEPVSLSQLYAKYNKENPKNPSEDKDYIQDFDKSRLAPDNRDTRKSKVAAPVQKGQEPSINNVEIKLNETPKNLTGDSLDKYQKSLKMTSGDIDSTETKVAKPANPIKVGGSLKTPVADGKPLSVTAPVELQEKVTDTKRKKQLNDDAVAKLNANQRQASRMRQGPDKAPQISIPTKEQGRN